jgi:hypothetical protein
MTRLQIAAGIIALIASWSAVAAPASPEQCAALADAYEDQIKDLSNEEARDLFTGDKMVQIARNTRQSVHAGLAQANLTMLVANDCPMPTAPARIGSYLGPALECADAMQKAVAAKPNSRPENPPSCVRASWKRQAGR